MKPRLENNSQQLLTPHELKDDILATVTHELRTPLTSIRAVSGILHENPDLDIRQRDQFLTIILEESEKLTGLVEEMLDLAELELGRAEWYLTQVDLAQLIGEAVADVEQLLCDQNICLQLRLPDHVPLIMVDRNRIKRVILCLLNNAIKFCDDSSGWIGVRMHVYDNSLQVDVSDNGIGIHASDRHQIMDAELGGWISNTFGEEPQTTSLGLLVSRNIVAHFGGKLWFDGDLQHGAKFSFTLPLRRV
ncbi:MAG: HAMP domain-containing histidine kinase [Anaerolineae bacterium]|nr:HAMP domain-containing histidine kinase [Anaerolineae bacterium]